MIPRFETNTGIVELDDKVSDWLQWNQNKSDEEDVMHLIASNDIKALSKLFLKRMEFGTAGLRGRMGPGFSQMNDLVIIQTGQGLVKYLTQTLNNVADKGVIIGYDGRYNSKRFAELTAAIFISNNIKVYLNSRVCPTPFIPYGVLKYKCAAGIMVTASHNPKEDNGYKLYWENGAQIITPHDKMIQKSIMENLAPLESSWEIAKVYTSSLFVDPLDELMESYLTDIKEAVTYPEVNRNTLIKFTYTAMHGVGFLAMEAAFKAANFKPFIVVEEQKDPDPEFPTVKFPNPEEGKSALNLSMKTADDNGSTIILANDPDADRLACAIKDKDGLWRIFNGNELGALLGWWMIHTYQVCHPEASITNAVMMSSTVSSKILKSLAKKEGFCFEETLTGFKWMGNRAVELMKEGKEVLFAYEEAIGFMCGAKVLDKDGISAGVRLAEMAAYLEGMGLTLVDKLDEIYAEYGHHISDNSYWICHDQEIIQSIFEKLRNYSGQPNTYPTGVLDGKYPIAGIRDLTTGYDNTKQDNKATLPVSKSSQMITFTFNNGLVATLRTSGTEPRIKYYSELCGTPGDRDTEKLSKVLKEMIEAVVKEFLRPQENGLIARMT